MTETVILLALACLILSACSERKSIQRTIQDVTGGGVTVDPPPPPPPPPPTSRPKTIVVAGQSNGLGVPSPAYQAVQGVVMEGGALAGPGYPFGVMMMQHEHVPVTVVQCAVDGSVIERWTPGGDLYQACLSKVGGRKVDAFLFVQGEAEAQMPNAYPWADAFSMMLQGFSTSWGAFPVVYAQLGIITSPPWNVPNLQHVKDQQALSERNGVAMVSTDFLGAPQLDGIHRSPRQNEDLAVKMYQAYLAQGVRV